MLDRTIPLIVTFVLSIVASVAGVKYKRGKEKVTTLLLDVIAAVQDCCLLWSNSTSTSI